MEGQSSIKKRRGRPPKKKYNPDFEIRRNIRLEVNSMMDDDISNIHDLDDGVECAGCGDGETHPPYLPPLRVTTRLGYYTRCHILLPRTRSK